MEYIPLLTDVYVMYPLALWSSVLLLNNVRVVNKISVKFYAMCAIAAAIVIPLLGEAMVREKQVTKQLLPSPKPQPHLRIPSPLNPPPHP